MTPPSYDAGPFDIAGKVAVVTGGSRGIGRMVAEGLVRGGVRVYVSSRKADACEQAASQLRELGDCIPIPADLATNEGVAELAARITEAEPQLDVLVNNAGATWGAPVESFPPSAFDKVMALNVRAVFDLTRQLLPLLRSSGTASDPARVINIGSAGGIVAPPPGTNNFSYTASKAAVHMLTRHLAKELAVDNITVNAVAPGPFPSNMMAFIFDDPQSLADLRAGLPLRRTGEPADIAGVVAFLASRAANYITGVVLPVDGGMSL